MEKINIFRNSPEIQQVIQLLHNITRDKQGIENKKILVIADCVCEQILLNNLIKLIFSNQCDVQIILPSSIRDSPGDIIVIMPQPHPEKIIKQLATKLRVH